MSLLGIDHALLRLCPARERLRILLLEGIALLNCITVAYALGIFLLRFGESPYIAALAGGFAGAWFACIQLLMVLSRGGSRSMIRSPLSGLFCLTSLSGIGLSASFGISFGMGLPPNRWFDGLTLFVLTSFIIPWIAARRLVYSGRLYHMRQEAEAECLRRWYLIFIPRYETLARSKLKNDCYRIPTGMAFNLRQLGARSPTRPFSSDLP